MTEPSSVVDRLGGSTLAGRYSLEIMLGAGGMGSVYLATDTRLTRRVAIKVLDGSSVDEEQRARFLREAALLAKVRHAHVVAVHDVDVCGERPFMVMELLDGEDLGTIARGWRRLPAQERARLAIDVGQQIASALRASHERGVVHQDIKPDNIVCTFREDGVHATLIDFGIALPTDATPRPTGDDPIAGTPEYLAPERLRIRDGEPAADVYSLGVVLYEVLVGETPFASPTVAEILTRIAFESPLPIADVLASKGEPALDYPAELLSLIDRMLARDPEARPTPREVERVLASIPDSNAREPIRFRAIASVRVPEHRPELAPAFQGSGILISARTDEWVFAYPSTVEAMTKLAPLVRAGGGGAVHALLDEALEPSELTGESASAHRRLTSWFARFAGPGQLLLSESAAQTLPPPARDGIALHGAYHDGTGTAHRVYRHRTTTGSRLLPAPITGPRAVTTRIIDVPLALSGRRPPSTGDIPASF